MQKIITIFMITIMTNYSYAQKSSSTYVGTKIYSHIEGAKSNDNYLYPGINAQVKNYTIYDADAGTISKNIANSTKSNHNFKLSLENTNWDFTIWKTDLRAPNYILRSGNGTSTQEVTPSEVSTYKGYVNGNPKNMVRINIRNNHIEGIITLKEETYAIQTLDVLEQGNTSNNIVVYNNSDLIEIEGLSCGAHDPNDNIVREYEKLKSEKASGAKKAFKCTELALAADNAFRQSAGGINQAETRLLDILNFVQGFYDSQEIDYKVVEIFVSTNTNNNTWGNHADANSLLSGFTNWNGFTNPYDVASLYTSVNLSANGQSGVIGLAWLRGVCISNLRYNVVEYFSGWGTNNSRHAVDQAHELGHNWSANHVNCNSCIMRPALNGFNTAWSATTNNAIANWKNGGNGNCLDNGPCVITDAPTIEFTANNLFGCNSLTVQFTDNSTNVPTSWSWDFGDGSPASTQQNPTHTYSVAGDYTVTLTATNVVGSNTDIKNQYISVGTGQPLSTITGGPVDNTFANGGNYNAAADNGLVFNVTKDCVLESVKVYSDAVGNRTIEILDGVNGNVLFSRRSLVFTGERRMPVGADLKVGNQYFIKLGASDDLDLYRNNTFGTNYPYDVGGLISITNSNLGGQYYYFFYDWEVREKGCTTATGTSELSSISGIEVFPNPMKDNLNIKLPSDAAGSYNVTISDYTGKIIKTLNYTSSQSNNSIDISSLAGGLYIVRVIDEKSNSALFKVVKN